MTVFVLLNSPMKLIGKALISISDVRISLTRLIHLLDCSEIEEFIEFDDPNLPDGTIRMKNACFSWVT